MREAIESTIEGERQTFLSSFFQAALTPNWGAAARNPRNEALDPPWDPGGSYFTKSITALISVSYSASSLWCCPSAIGVRGPAASVTLTILSPCGAQCTVSDPDYSAVVPKRHHETSEQRPRRGPARAHVRTSPLLCAFEGPQNLASSFTRSRAGLKTTRKQQQVTIPQNAPIEMGHDGGRQASVARPSARLSIRACMLQVLVKTVLTEAPSRPAMKRRCRCEQRPEVEGVRRDECHYHRLRVIGPWPMNADEQGARHEGVGSSFYSLGHTRNANHSCDDRGPE